MLQTSARIVMTGLAAVSFGALSGWILIDKFHQKSASPTARAASAVLPNSRAAADEKSVSAIKPAAAPTPAAGAPAAEPIRTAAPARVPAPAPEAAPAPATPAGDKSGKPRVRIDKDRGEASLDIDDLGISTDTGGKTRLKAPGGFTVEPEGRRLKVRGPGGVDFDIDW